MICLIILAEVIYNFLMKMKKKEIYILYTVIIILIYMVIKIFCIKPLILESCIEWSLSEKHIINSGAIRCTDITGIDKKEYKYTIFCYISNFYPIYIILYLIWLFIIYKNKSKQLK